MIAGIIASARPYAVAAAETDPYWSNVVALLHFDGSDGATTSTDQKGHAVTMDGTSLSSTHKKFGATSCLFSGGSYGVVNLPTGTDFDFGSGDFTIEFFVRLTSLPSIAAGLVTKREGSVNYAPFYMDITPAGKVSTLASVTGSTWISTGASSATIATGVWYHMALVRDGGTLRRFINGSADGTAAISGSLMTNSQSVCIGAAAASKEYTLTGYIDEVRITKGVARYTTGFTVPTEAFPSS